MSSSNYFQSVADKIAASHPGMEPEFATVYALLALTKGAATTMADVHDAWAAVRYIARPDHADLIPFDQVAPEVQAYDRPFLDTIHAVSAELTQ